MKQSGICPELQRQHLSLLTDDNCETSGYVRYKCGVQLVLLLCQDVDEAFIDCNSPPLQSQQACLLWFDALTKH